MQATPRSEKGRRPGKTPTPMQAAGDSAQAGTPPQPPARAPHLTPRHRRMLLALLAGPQTREEMDRIVGASNGPDEVMRVRRRFGLAIPCERRKGWDRDRHRVEFGVYSLSATDRPAVQRVLKEAGR